MTIGDKLPILFVIESAAKPLELVEGQVINNVRGNKFWVVPVGRQEPRLLVCIDGDAQDAEERRKRIVALIEDETIHVPS